MNTSQQQLHQQQTRDDKPVKVSMKIETPPTPASWKLIQFYNELMVLLKFIVDSTIMKLIVVVSSILTLFYLLL